MEVEVVAGEVGEDRRVETASHDPIECEGVGGHLHRHVGCAELQHVGEEGLEHGRLGCGERGGTRRVAAAVGNRADHAGLPARRPPDRFEEVGRGRLSVGAGHADQLQRAARITSEARGEVTEQASRRVRPYHRNARRVDCSRRHHGDRPPCQRLDDVPTAIVP